MFSKIHPRALALAAVLIWCVGGHAAENPVNLASEMPAATAVTPIFGELFAYELPAGFKMQGTQTRADYYTQSVILSTDPVAGPWTQRILLTGSKDYGKRADLTAKMFAMQIVKGFQAACPATFVGGGVADAKIETGHSIYIVLVGCGSHTLTTSGAATSEVTLVAVVKGSQNMYSLQWAERGEPLSSAPKPDVAVWGSRLKAITPLLVCAPQPDEAAPYPSCSSRR